METVNIVVVFVLISVSTCDSHEFEETSVSKTCKLSVTDQSRAEFTTAVLRHDYNFMYMYLDFVDINHSIKYKKYVIGANHWVWTYKGKDGGHEYLFIPQDFGYLSFGLLWSKCNSSEYVLRLTHTGNCSGLTVGESDSDQLIGEAMGEMTSGIAARNDYYNSSYWCYYKRLVINPTILYRACSNTVCTLQSIEFRCCKYIIDFVTKKRTIVCSKQHYHFDSLWWALPIVAGIICFSVYPLFLSTIGGKLHASTRRSYWRSADEESNSSSDSLRKVEYIRLRQEYPVTLLVTVFTPFQKMFNCHGTLCTRLWRSLIIIVPMVLPAVRTGLDAHFAPNLVREALKAGAVIGFSSVGAGYEYSGHFLYLLGGPYVAISMYVVFGLLFITFPRDLEALVVKGLFEPQTSNNPYFILTIPIQYRERLGRMNVRRTSGYKRVHQYLLLQTLMVLNLRFWRYAMRIYVHRWFVCINYIAQKLISNNAIMFILSVVSFPIYLIFCIFETLFSLVYFVLPVVSCFFILLNAYILSLKSHFISRSLSVRILEKLCMLGTILTFCIAWYMYCIFFFDGFWFLSRIVMFSYTGLIQFPQLSYGYIVLAFMAFYYLIESLNNFGSGYRDLLKLSIDVCEKVQTKNQDDFSQTLVRKNSIPRRLFDIIVEKHSPKRVKVCSTILRVVTIVSILAISIDLLITFDKFSDLPLVTHVFTVLFICALPKLLRDLFIKRLRHKSKKKLRQRIYETVLKYCSKQGDVDDTSDLDVFSTASTSGYERFDIESD